MDDFKQDIDTCVKVLLSGGLILYPTDTIWGLGCDATNSSAIEKIFTLKKRPESKSLILLSTEQMVKGYTDDNTDTIFPFLKTCVKPTTFIYKRPKNLPANLVSDAHTIAIRIPHDYFCFQLLQSFKKPIVSTSANLSGNATAFTFKQIASEIKNGVDYIVQHRQDNMMSSQPSTIVTLDEEGAIKIIRP